MPQMRSVGRSPIQREHQTEADENEVGDLSFGVVMMQRLNHQKNKKKLKEVGHQPSLVGNILDIKAKRKPVKKPKTACSDDKDKYFNSFVPDIDNFEGVKLIKNYCIASLLDNGYGVGDTSAGVI